MAWAGYEPGTLTEGCRQVEPSMSAVVEKSSSPPFPWEGVANGPFFVTASCKVACHRRGIADRDRGKEVPVGAEV